MAQENIKASSEEDEEIDLKQLLEQYMYYWRWFLGAVLITVAVALVYLRYATPQFEVSAKILLESEDKATGDLAGLAELSSLTGGGVLLLYLIKLKCLARVG